MRFSVLSTLVAISAFASAFNDATDTIEYQNSGNKGHFTQNKPGIGVTTPEEYSSVDTFQEGDLINVTWTTIFPVFDVVVLQPTVSGGANIGVLSSSVKSADVSSYPWSASRTTLGGGEGNPIGPMYYFMVRNSSNINDYFTSSFFNVTKSNGNNKPSNTATASATKTPTAGAGLAPPGATTTTAASSSPSADPGSSGSSSMLSGGAIAGIVVGVVVGLSVIAGAAWRLWWVPRQRKAIVAATVNPPPGWIEKEAPPKWAPYDPSRDVSGAAAGATTVPGHDAVHEVDATPHERGPTELP